MGGDIGESKLGSERELYKYINHYYVVVKLLFLTFSVLVANPKKTTLHGGQSRSWSAEQGKENKRKTVGCS